MSISRVFGGYLYFIDHHIYIQYLSIVITFLTTHYFYPREVMLLEFWAAIKNSCFESFRLYLNH